MQGATGGQIEQGPRWIVELVYGAPTWLQNVYSVVGLLLLGVAVLGLHRSGWELDEELQREMIEIGAILVGVISATTALVNLANVPYHYDVVGGWLGGVVLAHLSITAGRHISIVVDGLEEPKRLALAWGTVGTLALFLPNALATGGQGTLILGSRLTVLAVGMGMMFYNLRDVGVSPSSA